VRVLSAPTTPTDSLDAPSNTADPREGRAKSARVLRSVWRIHFYAAFIAVPYLLLQIVTGLIIMYSGPIMGVLYGDVMRVEPAGQIVPLQTQREEADTAVGEGAVLGAVQTPREPGDATAFQYSQDDGTTLNVYVNPYTGQVTGTHVNGSDVVGLANRLHGFLNNDSLTVPLPALSHLIDPDSGPLIQDYGVGDLVLEIATGWTLVLTIAGLFLWWPRKSQKGKALLVPRIGKQGLIRWRDVHAVSGIVAIAALFLFLVTGLPWAGYWGATWSAVAAKVTPAVGPWDASAPSTLAEVGDLNRYGQPISWAQQETGIPTSGSGGGHEGHGGNEGHEGHGSDDGSSMAMDSGSASASVPAPVDLTVVARAAADEGMLPGYGIYLPADEVTEAGSTTYGSYTLMNFWPQRLQDERTLVLDQFSGTSILDSTYSDYGAVQATTQLGVNTHMGTQFGFWNTVWVTVSCVLLLVAIYSAIRMWWIRRPSGKLGLPKRPASPALTAGVIGIAVALMIIYPVWGVTALLVLALDKFVIQRVPALRRTFEMPADA
jgi:uncharacterized iron-regulated membrane protein